MLLEEFWEHKKEIKQQLEQLLADAKKRKASGDTNFRRSILQEVSHTISVRLDDNSVDDLNTLVQYRNKHPKAEVRVKVKSEYEYCRDTPIATNYTFITYELVDEITEQMVQHRMRQFVRNKLNLGIYDDLKCEVMQLFKDGKISWEDVESQHKGGCKI